MTGWRERWMQRVKQLKTDTYAIYLAYKDPRTPWIARILIGFVVIHTLSPIDLIPDFIPVLGYLDDLVIVPLGVALALKLVPEDVMAECRVRAEALMSEEKPTSWVAAAIIVATWLAGAALVVIVILRLIEA